jgi:hypothetical protein
MCVAAAAGGPRVNGDEGQPTCVRRGEVGWACMFTPPCPTGQEAARGPGRYHGYPQSVIVHITQTRVHVLRVRVCVQVVRSLGWVK